MATTQDFTVSSEKSWPQPRTCWSDPFTIQNGHYIGHDGFIVPNNFAEFHQWFPAYVADWVRNRTRGCISGVEAEDWTQELLLFLAVLPLKSKHRISGKQDVIQTFAPERMHGANEARFRSFINRCLSNKFNTLYRKWRKSPHSNPRNLPFAMDYEGGADDEYCQANSACLRARERLDREQFEQRLRLNEFVRIAGSAVPDISRMVSVYVETGNWEETARLVGRKQCTRIRLAARQLASSTM